MNWPWQLRCPKCNSKNIKKGQGVSPGTALVSMLFFGPLGFFLGAIIIKHKCLDCNYTWHKDLEE